MNKEYISRDEMIEQTKARIVLGAPKFNTGLESAIEVATNIPAADVVEVVRCKDCICWEKYDGTNGELNCGYCSEILDRTTYYLFFCADGKREDGGQDK